MQFDLPLGECANTQVNLELSVGCTETNKTLKCINPTEARLQLVDVAELLIHTQTEAHHLLASNRINIEC